jgi:hypothetical protein
MKLGGTGTRPTLARWRGPPPLACLSGTCAASRCGQEVIAYMQEKALPLGRCGEWLVCGVLTAEGVAPPFGPPRNAVLMTGRVVWSADATGAVPPDVVAG